MLLDPKDNEKITLILIVIFICVLLAICTYLLEN